MLISCLFTLSTKGQRSPIKSRTLRTKQIKSSVFKVVQNHCLNICDLGRKNEDFNFVYKTISGMFTFCCVFVYFGLFVYIYLFTFFQPLMEWKTNFKLIYNILMTWLKEFILNGLSYFGLGAKRTWPLKWWKGWWKKRPGLGRLKQNLWPPWRLGYGIPDLSMRKLSWKITIK